MQKNGKRWKYKKICTKYKNDEENLSIPQKDNIHTRYEKIRQKD